MADEHDHRPGPMERSAEPPLPPALPEQPLPAEPAAVEAPQVPPVEVPSVAVPPVDVSAAGSWAGDVATAGAPARAPRSPGLGIVVLVAALVSLVVASFAGLAGAMLGAHVGGPGLPGRSASTVRVIPPETDEPVVAASAAALPSVVNIEVRQKPGTGDSELPESHPNVPLVGNGSGVAYKSSEDGGTYVITNDHVVKDARRVTIRDVSGKSRDAEVIGTDPESDIAVLLVDAAITTIKTTDSSRLTVGQTVVAIGSPYGLEHSVTSGVVSALGRSLPNFVGAPNNSYPLIDVIQTDAAINPGNSGGALVDREGRLVGINTAIYSDTGANGGIGFAVPSNTAIRVADQLISGTKLTHPFLGVIGQTVTEELADELDLTVQEGAHVAEVVKGSGALAAGLKAGDVVTGVDGAPVRTMDDLMLQVRRKQVGDRVTLDVKRGAEALTIVVTVGDKPAEIESSTDKAPDNND